MRCAMGVILQRVLPTIEQVHDSMNRWFGPSWGAPVNEPELEIAVPIGVPCAYCEEPFVAGDQGLTMLHFGIVLPDDVEQLHATKSDYERELWLNKRMLGKHRPEHLDCRMVAVIGHVSCQLNHPHDPRGVCPGDAPRDPPGLTRREAARLAVRMWEQRRRAG